MVEWRGSFGIYFVITDISRFYGLFSKILLLHPPGATPFILRFYRPFFFSYTLRGPSFYFLRFYQPCFFLLLLVTPWAPFLDCQKEGKEQPKV